MKTYNVCINYCYQIEAEKSEEAEEKALKFFDEDAPRSDEMGVSTEEWCPKCENPIHYCRC